MVRGLGIAFLFAALLAHQVVWVWPGSGQNSSPFYILKSYK